MLRPNRDTLPEFPPITESPSTVPDSGVSGRESTRAKLEAKRAEKLAETKTEKTPSEFIVAGKLIKAGESRVTINTKDGRPINWDVERIVRDASGGWLDLTKHGSNQRTKKSFAALETAVAKDPNAFIVENLPEDAIDMDVTEHLFSDNEEIKSIHETANTAAKTKDAAEISAVELLIQKANRKGYTPKTPEQAIKTLQSDGPGELIGMKPMKQQNKKESRGFLARIFGKKQKEVSSSEKRQSDLPPLTTTPNSEITAKNIDQTIAGERVSDNYAYDVAQIQPSTLKDAVSHLNLKATNTEFTAARATLDEAPPQTTEDFGVIPMQKAKRGYNSEKRGFFSRIFGKEPQVDIEAYNPKILQAKESLQNQGNYGPLLPYGTANKASLKKAQERNTLPPNRPTKRTLLERLGFRKKKFNVGLEFTKDPNFITVPEKQSEQEYTVPPEELALQEVPDENISPELKDNVVPFPNKSSKKELTPTYEDQLSDAGE